MHYKQFIIIIIIFENKTYIFLKKRSFFSFFDQLIIHDRASPAQRKVIESQIEDMLNNNIIEPSKSPWASPIVLVDKKDGSIRFCVDYRKLNTVTKRDVYPLPRIDDCLNAIGGNKYFSTFDLAAGYWQILMNKEDKEKTAFISHHGLYQFNVMSFGLTNAPATLQRFMDNCFAG